MHFRSPAARRRIERMKTLLYQDRISLDTLTFVERPVPAPGPRELLLRMRAVALNHRDLAIARGTYGAFSAPLVPLSDGAGEVVALGRGVTRFRTGDLVCPIYVPDWIDGPVRPEFARRRLGGPSDGVAAEYVVVDEEAAVHAPAHLDAREAATLPIAAVTAWQVLFQDAAVRPGETVAVQGTGGVSLFVAQLARAAGARALLLTRGAERAARVRALGFTALDTQDAPDAPDRRDWAPRVLAATGGRGADVFVDVVGGDALARAVAATRVGGTVAIVGFVGGQTAPLDVATALRRAVTLRAASAGSRASFEALGRALTAAGIRPIVDRVLPLSRAAEALTALESGRPFGKIVLSFDEK